MFDLTEIDAKILQFIDSCGTADTVAIKKRFPNTAIEYRLKKLSTPEVRYLSSSSIAVPIENTCFLNERTEQTVIKGYCHVEHLGIYELTEYGKRELEDYLAAKKTGRKELWLKNAWIPIIVSLVTSAIANYILPKLPQILRWAANTLSKIVS